MLEVCFGSARSLAFRLCRRAMDLPDAVVARTISCLARRYVQVCFSITDMIPNASDREHEDQSAVASDEESGDSATREFLFGSWVPCGATSESWCPGSIHAAQPYQTSYPSILQWLRTLLGSCVQFGLCIEHMVACCNIKGRRRLVPAFDVFRTSFACKQPTLQSGLRR